MRRFDCVSDLLYVLCLVALILVVFCLIDALRLSIFEFCVRQRAVTPIIVNTSICIVIRGCVRLVDGPLAFSSADHWHYMHAHVHSHCRWQRIRTKAKSSLDKFHAGRSRVSLPWLPQAMVGRVWAGLLHFWLEHAGP